MATGHFFRTSGDVGAPDLVGDPGTLIAVLDWALDIGQPGAVWEKPFTGTNKAAYRATTGIRPYLRVVDDESSEGASTTRATCRMYASMSDIDTGLGVAPAAGHNFAANGVYWYKKLRNDQTPAYYVVVGDSRGFILFVRPNEGDTSWGRMCSMYFFGEPVPLDPTDQYAALLLGDASSVTYTSAGGRFLPFGAYSRPNTSYNSLFNGDAADNPGVWLKNSAGTADGPSCVAVNLTPNAGQVVDGPVVHGWPWYLWSNPDGLSTTGKNRGYIRGRLPYAYFPTTQNFAAGWSHNDTLDMGSSQFRLVECSTSTGSDTGIFIRESNDEPGRV